MSEQLQGYREVGRGQNVFVAKAVEGPLKWLATPADVIEFVTSGAVAETIVLSRGGTTTFMAPALTAGAKGLITLQGGPKSHLGIVSREFGVPCVMSVQFTEGIAIPTGEIVPPDGTVVRLGTTTSPTAPVYAKDAP
jgi:phosphoenolpyruvate-protein kinase (PTS system EI component)